MKRMTLVLGLVIAAPLVACGGSTPDNQTGTSSSAMTTVHGMLPPSVKALDNARAIAVGADGHTYAAYLDPKGSFTLTLPVGHAYRIVFANSRIDGSEVILGHLVINTSHGKQEFFGARAGGTVELGAVAPVAMRAGGVQISCN